VDVDRTQAGLAVNCACGRRLEVPTIRGFAELETRAQPASEPASTWGPRQGVMFLGVAIALLASAAAIYARFFPKPNRIQGVDHAAIVKLVDDLTPTQTFEMWSELSRGMDRQELPDMLRYWDYLAQRNRWSWVAWGVAAVGGVIAAVGALIPKDDATRRPTARTPVRT